MALFSKLFSSSSTIEKHLEKFYVHTLQMIGMSPAEAKNNVRDILKQAKEKSMKEGTSNLPQNFGDILLEKKRPPMRKLEPCWQRRGLKVSEMKI